MPGDAASLRLKDKRVLVIGAGGIGNELALRYAGEGASVLLTDRNPQVAEEAAAAFDGAGGGRLIAGACNGADEESVNEAVALAVSEFGGLDGLHANFASFLDGRSKDGALGLPLDIYDEMMAVNARGFLLATRAALPPIIAAGGGAIVYTSSGAAHTGDAVRPFYAMSKAAGHALMRHVAKRHGADGVRANTIAPGIIMHRALRENASPGFEEGAKQRTPYRLRLGEPNDIAALGTLLLSDEGAFITGQVISVDGGSTMRS